MPGIAAVFSPPVASPRFAARTLGVAIIAVLSATAAACGSDPAPTTSSTTTATPFTIDRTAAYAVWPEISFDESLAAAPNAGRWRTSAQGTAERLVEEVLAWDDGLLVDVERVADSDRNEERYRFESSAVGAEATVTLMPVPETSIWVVTHWLVTSGDEPSLGISIGNGDDGVSYGSQIGAETANFAIRYGSEAVDEDSVDLASNDRWEPGLDQSPNTPGMVSVAVTDGLRAVVEGVATPLPPGPFAAS